VNLAFHIARRYLFSKKSHQAVNIISLVSALGVMVVTAAIVCALSVMNGFNSLVFSMFSALDPELEITPAKGKVFDPDTPLLYALGGMPGVASVGKVLEDNVLLRYGNRQVIGKVMGVDSNYERLTGIDSILVDGAFKLHDPVADYATLGIGLAYALGVNAGFTAPLEIYAPRRDERVNMANPAASFDLEYAYIGGVFRTDQPVYDEDCLLVPISLARRLFHYDKQVSALQLRATPHADISRLKESLRRLLGKDYVVRDRYEQQESSYKMVQTEKWVIFLILCFILLIALFSMVGSLSMLMIEKKDDVRTLRNLGAEEGLIRHIFLFEGWMITGLGALTGLLLGLGLCLLQQHFGLIKMGAHGTFVVDNYPVVVQASDLLFTLLAVGALGFLSAWYPVYVLGHNPRRP
jgi:ABC-type lipoprotein release transport system permease subunit